MGFDKNDENRLKQIWNKTLKRLLQIHERTFFTIKHNPEDYN